MNAVRADRHIRHYARLLGRAIDEQELDLIIDLVDANATLIQAKHLVRQRLSERGSQVRAMGHVTVTAVEALTLLSHRLDEKHPAVLPAPKLPRSFQANCEVRQSLSQSDSAQRTHHVRRHNDSSANVGKFWRLFVNGHLDVRMLQEDGGGQPP